MDSNVLCVCFNFQRLHNSGFGEWPEAQFYDLRSVGCRLQKSLVQIGKVEMFIVQSGCCFIRSKSTWWIHFFSHNLIINMNQKPGPPVDPCSVLCSAPRFSQLWFSSSSLRVWAAQHSPSIYIFNIIWAPISRLQTHNRQFLSTAGARGGMLFSWWDVSEIIGDLMINKVVLHSR